MARNTKIDTNPNKDRETESIHIKLDAETKQIYKRAVKYHNMSEWFRKQLRIHCQPEGLDPIQKAEVLREEMMIAAMVKQDKIVQAEEEYYATVAKIQRRYANREVIVETNTEAQ